MAALEKFSPCKVNLLLNILGRRADGFHELETVLHPIHIFDQLSFAIRGVGIQLSCSHPDLPTDSKNLVYRAAAAFLEAAKIQEGVGIHLEKRIPLAAGLGGGSANAAVTLSALNELFGTPLSSDRLHRLAAGLGSDVPFFLQDKPALATGRGEQIEALDYFQALQGAWILVIHPGFGISTAWAYQQLPRFPESLKGTPGRARALVSFLQSGADLQRLGSMLYNSLEAPALRKYPLLAIFQDFLRTNGAVATLMSGSGSSTFAVVANRSGAEDLQEKVRSKFGPSNWVAILPLQWQGS